MGDPNRDGEVALNHDWEFRKGSAGKSWIRGADAQGSEKTDLPHCWNDRDAFQDSVAYYRGKGAYRKTFSVPVEARAEDDSRWLLKSEGFYGTGDVWLNGKKLGNVDGEYLGFALDVTEVLDTSGENILVVRLTNKCARHVLPGIKDPDFLLYGGLSGRVSLKRCPSLRFDADETRIVVNEVLSTKPRVEINCGAINSSAKTRQASVRWTIYGPDGTEVADGGGAAQELPGSAALQMSATELAVKDPVLWSLKSPSLYVAKGELVEDGMVVDSIDVRFGMRRMVFEPAKGFFLNGQRLVLRGCNRHESMPGFGRALTLEQHREDARVLRDCGCNLVRLSHYPQHPAFLDACDELGLLVYAEVASWKSVRAGRWLRSARRQMERMIRRDRNRPSVILWGLGNESRSKRAFAELGNLVSEMDPSRATIYAENHLYRAKREKTLGMTDVYGCNYELDVLEEAAATARTGASLVSECSNVPTAVRGEAVEELRQVDTIENDLSAIGDMQCNAGYVLWCMNDYATLRKKRYVRYCGIVDGWRMTKPAYAFLRAGQLAEPVISLFGDWGEGGDRSSERDVHVFTNCDTISILRNGAEIASLSGGLHTWHKIGFEPGELTVVGCRDGEEVRDTITSHGVASRIVLEPAKESASGSERETVDIRIRILDEAGVLCRDWAGVVMAQVAGPARSRAYKADGSVPVWAGEGRLFVTGTGQTGEATVVASADGVADGSAAVVFE